MLVASGAERLVAGTGEHNHSYLGGIAAIIEGIEYFFVCERTESVVYFRPVDCDFGYSFIELEENVAIVFDF